LTSDENKAVQFAATATGSGPLTYSWNFGDGTAAGTTLNPSHTYANSGSYTATLTVTDGTGASKQDTVVVQVNNVAPTVSLGTGYAGAPGSPIAFAATVTDPSAADTAAGFSYLWDFGDGTSSTQNRPSHTYAAAGTYTVKLTVTDQDGGARAVTTTATVAQAAPPGSFINTHHDKIPNFGANPTIVSAGSGNWSDVRTWSLGRLPTDNDVVSVAAGHTVSYDAASTARLKTVAIQAGGRLLFRTDVSTKLMVANFLVMAGGELQIGTQANPVAASVKAEVIFLNQALDTVADPEQFGNGLIALGKVTMHGAAQSQTFVRLASEPKAGDTTLTLAQAVTGWRVGDRLSLPDTRHLKEGETWSKYVPQWELMTIQSISPDGRTITLASPLQFDHIGARNAVGGLEFLPHVGNLTRNVVVKSESAAGVRGHTMFTERADVDIRYAQFSGLGRTTKASHDNTKFDANGNVTHIGTNQLGRYAVHFHHLMGPVATQANGHQFTFVGNAVSCPMNPMPFRWGITVHDAHYGLIKDNVLYNWAGAGIITETGNESFNVFERNFVMASRGDVSARQNDGLYGAGFWFRGFNNYIRDNVAASNNSRQQEIVAGAGFDLFSPAASKADTKIPLFPGADLRIAGQYKLVDMQLTPILEFARNEAYGATATGLVMWGLGTDGYVQRPIGQSIIKDFVAWHVHDEGFFAYPIQNVLFDGFTVRGHTRALNPFDGGTGWQSGDYWAGNVTIRRADIQGMWTGITTSTNTPGTFRVEDSYFRNAESNIKIHTLSTPGTRANMPARRMEIWNTLFEPWSPTGTFQAIVMKFHPNGHSNFIQKDEVFVYNYNRVAGDNFQVFYLEQAPDFIVPQTTFMSNGQVDNQGSPEAGLTNQQNWAKYGIAMAGAVSPTTKTRANIVGYVLPF
jgi:PKD repeat protein